MILYTYSMEPVQDEDRWQDTGIRDCFFEDLDQVRQQIMELHAEALEEAKAGEHEQTWRPMRIERVEILPMVDGNLLILLNRGLGPLIQSYEIVEIIG